MKLLGSTESKITVEKNSKNVPHLEVVELVSNHCNIVDNSYQENSRILYIIYYTILYIEYYMLYIYIYIYIYILFQTNHSVVY